MPCAVRTYAAGRRAPRANRYRCHPRHRHFISRQSLFYPYRHRSRSRSRSRRDHRPTARQFLDESGISNVRFDLLPRSLAPSLLLPASLHPSPNPSRIHRLPPWPFSNTELFFSSRYRVSASAARDLLGRVIAIPSADGRKDDATRSGTKEGHSCRKRRRRRRRRTIRGMRRNLNERSGSDRDLIIELLAPVAANIINAG